MHRANTARQCDREGIFHRIRSNLGKMWTIAHKMAVGGQNQKPLLTKNMRGLDYLH